MLSRLPILVVKHTQRLIHVNVTQLQQHYVPFEEATMHHYNGNILHIKDNDTITAWKTKHNNYKLISEDTIDQKNRLKTKTTVHISSDIFPKVGSIQLSQKSLQFMFLDGTQFKFDVNMVDLSVYNKMVTAWKKTVSELEGNMLMFD